MYKWNPEDYQQHSSAQECIAAGIISELKIKGNEHILDIGCGDWKGHVKAGQSGASGPGVGH